CWGAGVDGRTGEQCGEIVAPPREAFSGGQKSFQLQPYPFRRTPLNMARYRHSPHMAFWKMIKEGYDHFEVTHLEPRVDTCEKRYVFDAESMGSFSPAAPCPAYKVEEDIAVAVRENHRRDTIETVELINRGVPTVPVTSGADGGMNPTFLAAVRSQRDPSAV